MKHRYVVLGLGAGSMLLIAVAVLLVAPAWAAPKKDAGTNSPGAGEAMHETCVAGDAQGMHGASDGLTGEDWQAMGEHMGDGHHEDMDAHMSSSGGMMGGESNEEWQAMDMHMGDGHHEDMDSHMSGSDGMMGGQPEGGQSSMMSW